MSNNLQVHEFMGEFTSLSSAVVPLSMAQLNQAFEWSQTALCEPRQWYIYRQGLAVLGVAAWFQDRCCDLELRWERCSLLQPAYAHLLYAPCTLTVGAFRIGVVTDCPLGQSPVSVPRAALELPEFLAHVLVLVRVHTEQHWVQIQGGLRGDHLTQMHQTTPLQLRPDWTYALPHHWFDRDPTHVLLWLRCLSPTALTLSPVVSSPEVVPPPSRLELERLLPYLRASKSNLWEIFTWAQAIAMLKDPVLLHWLYQAQRSTDAIESPPSSSQPLMVVSTPTDQRMLQGTINSQRWLPQEMEALTQPLTEETLTPLPPRYRSRLFQVVGADGIALIKALEYEGIDSPSTASGGYRDLRLGQLALRLYTLSWPLPPVANRDPEWILLLILGPQPETQITTAVTLQVRDVTQVLGTQTLTTESASTHLYAKILGEWEEQFWVTVCLEQAAPETTIRLSPFQFEPPSV